MASVMQTHRLALPLIQPGQAQKEMTHNEALLLLDLLVQPVVEGVADAVPAELIEGTCWIVGPEPVGVWAGQAGALAIWSAGGWRFVAAREGMRARVRSLGLDATFDGEHWQVGVATAGSLSIGGVQVVGARGAAIAAPADGAVIDAEARGAISQILAALRAHGLIETA